MNQLQLFGVAPTKNYFNTTRESGNPLRDSASRASIQDYRIMGIFKTNESLTPFDVHECYNKLYSEAPITSIRRSMTVLTNMGMLIKTNEMRVGKYGKKNYLWKKNNNND
jgi:hypothetical protein